MANQRQLEILKQGVDVWNKWRSDFEGPIDLTKADLRRVDLGWADLQMVRLVEANLAGSNFKPSRLDLFRSRWSQSP